MRQTDERSRSFALSNPISHDVLAHGRVRSKVVSDLAHTAFVVGRHADRCETPTRIFAKRCRFKEKHERLKKLSEKWWPFKWNKKPFGKHNPTKTCFLIDYKRRILRQTLVSARVARERGFYFFYISMVSYRNRFLYKQCYRNVKFW